MKETKKNTNEEIVKIPLDSEEEKVFQWVESDNCLGSWMPSKNTNVSEKTKYQFSQVITRYLVRNNLSEEEIANRLGLDKNDTVRLLRGYVENFSLYNLMVCAEKLKIKKVYSKNNYLSQIPNYCSSRFAIINQKTYERL